MFPQSPGAELFVTGSFSIAWYGICIAVAVFAAFLIIRYFAALSGEKAERYVDIAFWVVVFGFIGARLYHVWNEWWFYKTHIFELWRIWEGGLAFHGGLLFGLGALLLIAYQKKIVLLRLTDIFAPAVILAQAIGRWGNYFNEELFGKPYDGFLALSISPASRPEQFAAITSFHPLFLYEFILDLFLFILLFIIFKKIQAGSGLVTALYLFGYGVIRFSLDFLRFDQFGFWGLTLAQWVSIGMIIASGFLLWYARKQHIRSLSKESE